MSLTAALGGFLFGFDTAVASGTIGFLKSKFNLDLAMEGWIMSSALLGSVMGAAMAGYLSDKFGRKKILMFSGLLFLVSAIGSTFPESPTSLVLARIIGGIGVGIAAMVAPIFISELAPARLRGRLVSLYQLAITLGILVSYLSNNLLLKYAAENQGLSSSAFVFWDQIMVKEVWRGMYGMEVIPATFFFVFLFFVPESPRWLIKEGKFNEPLKILTKILGSQKAKQEVEEIIETVREESGNFKQLFEPGIRTALIIGLFLPFLSQLTGITTVMYYAPTLFENAGFGTSSAFGSAAIIGFFNMVFTFLAIWKIDQFGRKPLLIFGFLGLSLALTLIGWKFMVSETLLENNSGMLLVFFILYIAIFAATIGPGVWVLIAEIFPTKIRGRAMSLGTLSLFVGSTFVTQTFPVLRGNLGLGSTFFLYAAVMIPTVYFVFRLVPETKGKSLEEIEKSWLRQLDPKTKKYENPE